MSAAAVATGAPIATQSDAVSPLKVAQANNAVHIIPTGGSSTTSLMSGTTAPPPSNTSAVLSSSSHTALVKASSPATLDTPLVSNLSSLSPKQTKAELLANQDAKPADTCKYSGPEDLMKEQKKDDAHITRHEPSEGVKEDGDALMDLKVEFMNLPVVAESCNPSMKSGTAESELTDVVDKKAEGAPKANDDMNSDSPVKEDKSSVFQG